MKYLILLHVYYLMQTPLQNFHPGYGFFNENTSFVNIVESAGIVRLLRPVNM